MTAGKVYPSFEGMSWSSSVTILIMIFRIHLSSCTSVSYILNFKDWGFWAGIFWMKMHYSFNNSSWALNENLPQKKKLSANLILFCVNLKLPTRNLSWAPQSTAPNQKSELGTAIYGSQPKILVGHRNLRFPTGNLSWEPQFTAPNQKSELGWRLVFKLN